MFVVFAELYHKQEFLDSLRRIPNMKWQAGIPKRLEGMTKSQVKSLLHSNVQSINTPAVKLTGETPDAWSWVEEKPGCSGPSTVRDQGQCGSCWAFSSIDQLGDNRCISGLDEERVQYSEQYVVSCDPDNLGCDGGWLETVQNYLINTGTVTDNCSPYTSGYTQENGKCPKMCEDESELVFTKAAKTENVCTGEDSIKVALTKGVVQTAFTVYSDFMYYQYGIYEHQGGYQEGGHAVIIVGYGQEDETPYWIIKNSWGNYFGENGYFRIIRGQNECGIENQCFLLTP